MRYPSTNPEQDAFVATAKIELAKAQAEVARLETIAIGWGYGSRERTDLERAFASRAGHELRGAHAAVEFWRSRIPTRQPDGEIAFIDMNGDPIKLATPLSSSQSQQSEN